MPEIRFSKLESLESFDSFNQLELIWSWWLVAVTYDMFIYYIKFTIMDRFLYQHKSIQYIVNIMLKSESSKSKMYMYDSIHVLSCSLLFPLLTALLLALTGTQKYIYVLWFKWIYFFFHLTGCWWWCNIRYSWHKWSLFLTGNTWFAWSCR